MHKPDPPPTIPSSVIREMDLIARSELCARFKQTHSPLPWPKLEEQMESCIREIVRIHQTKDIEKSLPYLFSITLKLVENGEFYIDEYSVDKATYKKYMEKRIRMEVLIRALVNSISDPRAQDLFHYKYVDFEKQKVLIQNARELSQKALEIRKKLDSRGDFLPKDEESTLQFLRKISGMNAGIEDIQKEMMELRRNQCFEEAIVEVKSNVNLAMKAVDKKSHKARKYLFDQAASVFMRFKNKALSIYDLETCMHVKQTLFRYHQFFDATGDISRKKQTGQFIQAVEKAIEELETKISEAGKQDKAFSRKREETIEKAYARFLNIQNQYEQTGFRSPGEREKAGKILKSSMDILKSQGMLVKARDIERFLNTTEIRAKNETPVLFTSRFYRIGFFILLPLTSILLACCIFLLYIR